MLKFIKKNISLLLLSEIISSLMYLIHTIFLAYFLGTEGIGQYGFIFALSFVFSIILNFGMTDMTTKEISNNKKQDYVFMTSAIKIKIILSFIYVGIMLAIISFLRLNSQVKIALYFISLFYVFDSFTMLLNGYFRAKEKIKYEASINIFKDSLIVLICVLLLFLYKNILSFAIGYFVGSFVGLCISLICFLKIINPQKNKGKILIYSIIKKSTPFFLAEILLLIINKVDIIMLKILTQDSIVGIYEAGYMILDKISQFPIFIIIAFYPVFSKLINQNSKIKELKKKAQSYMLFFNIIMLIGVFLFGKIFINLVFGESFNESFLVLKIISIGMFFLYLNLINFYILNSAGKVYKNVFILVFCLLINICLNTILIPKLSYIGCAIGTLISYVILFVISEIETRKFIKSKKIELPQK